MDNLNEDDNDNKNDKGDKYEDKNGNDDKNDKDNKNGKDGIKDKDELFENYKKGVLKVLYNIYKTHRDSLLKEYFDKWRKASNLKGEEKEKDILKYIKAKINR